jgi:hypothetical protein
LHLLPEKHNSLYSRSNRCWGAVGRV